ncbi:hypothetical protein BGZ80_004733, partial [Entomortierella chlamydospora]
MSSKKAGLPSLNSINKKDGLQPVKVQRYRAGQAPEGYVDPALESSDEEEDENDASKTRRDGRSKGVGGATGGNMSISQEDQQPRVAYKILNIERMTKERQMEKKSQSQSIPDIPAGASGDRRLARLQAIQMEDRRSRGDVRSRRGRGGSDEDEEGGEEEEKEEEEDDEEEAALRRRKAARARAMREEAEEEELWGQGEEEEEEEEEDGAGRKGKSRREGE